MQSFDEARMRTDNLECLARIHPDLPGLILQSSEEAVEMTRIVGPTGAVSALLDSRLLHSPRNPRAEAGRILRSSLRLDEPTNAVFCGFGLGYLVEEFLSASPGSNAVIVEPDGAAFHRALGYRNLSAIFSSRRVSYLINGAPDDILSILTALPDLPSSIVQLRSVYERNAAYFSKVFSVIESYSMRKEVNRNTLIRFSRLWVRNLLGNLSVIENARGVSSLEGAFPGSTGLLVGGGPSLDAVIPYLRRLRDHCVVAAVDTGLTACIRGGILPDFLLVVDPQYWNTRHIDHAFWREAADGGLESVPRPLVVSESSTHPRIFRVLGKDVFLCGSLFPLGAFIERQIGSFGRLGAGGSVSTTAWDFLRMLGCSEILCAGIDLGFPGRQTHFRGSYFEERIHTLSCRTEPSEQSLYHYLHDAGLFTLPGYDDSPVPTDKRMSVYRWWFEAEAAGHPEVRTNSLYPRSVRIGGFGYRDTVSFLEEREYALGKAAQPPPRRAIDERLDRYRGPGGEGMAGSRASTVAAALERLGVEIAAARDLAQIGLDTVALARETTSKSPLPGAAGHAADKVSRAFTRLDDVDRQILSFENRDILGFLLQREVHAVTSSHNTEATETAKTEQMLANAESLYRGLKEAAEYHLERISQHSNGERINRS